MKNIHVHLVAIQSDVKILFIWEQRLNIIAILMKDQFEERDLN